MPNRLSFVDHEIEPSRDDGSVLPFEDLIAPQPIKATPPAKARWLAFGSILLGGALGAGVGYGVGDLMGGSSTWAGVGAIIGGLTGAIGVGVVSNLALRAMNEWRAVEHPEAALDHNHEDADTPDRTADGGAGDSPGDNN